MFPMFSENLKSLIESNFSNKIVCFPGNAGTSQIAKNIDIDILNFKEQIY